MIAQEVTFRPQPDTFESLPNGAMFGIGDLLYLKDENGNAVELSIGKVEELNPSEMVSIVETVTLVWP